MFPPRGIPDPHAFAFADDTGVRGLKRLVLHQMMPDMRAIRLYNI